MKSIKKGWGFDVRDLDPGVRPQDNFYQYVNKKWKDVNPIPKNESRWGTFNILRFETDKKLLSLMEELLTVPAPRGSDNQMIGDFYRSGMDVKTRNARGLTPVQPLLARINEIENFTDLITVISYLHRIGSDVVWNTHLDQDAKQSERYALHLSQGGIGMPDREYYLNNDAESVRVRGAYNVHVRKLFRLMGQTVKQAEESGTILLRIETSLAKVSMKKEDLRDADKIYNKFTPAALKKIAKEVDWNMYLKKLGIKELPYLIVMQPDFFKSVSPLLAAESLDDWKTYLRWHIVNDFSGVLSERFVRQSFSFYGKVLSGTTTMRPLWRRVLGTVNGGLGELIGKVYVERYFTKEAKKKMNLLVDDLLTAYEVRIKNLDWMTPVTKRKAIQKLKALNSKIGYPEKWKSFKGLAIDSGDYFSNILRMSEYVHDREMKKLKKPIDRGEWFMYPQTVNAYFAPTMNDIVFPAAILQSPFFDIDADDSVNYGSIGAVIGHEITHGFDDEGSKFDFKGNLKSWWSKEDRKRFEKKAKRVENQFNNYTVADGLKVNGKLTLGENIADLGGLSIAYEAYKLQLARTGRIDIDGLSPEQRFFISFAVFERENARPEFEKTQVLNDPHSPGTFRINGPVSNFTPFYEAFDVTKGDGLYRTPTEREIVW